MKECEDAISREKVLEITNEWLNNQSDDNIKTQFDLKLALTNLPFVYPKAKVGKWIESHIPESVLVECSECGFSCGARSFNYCPMCGANMEGVQE